MQKALFIFICCLSIFSIAPFAHAQTPEALEKAFSEDIKIALPPTTTVFDLFFAEKHYGEVLVTYTDVWAKIHDPQGVVDLLKEEISAPDVVEAFLTEENFPNFKKVTPSVGTVVFKPEKFQVEIQLEPEVLKVKELNRTLQALDPNKQPKLVNNFSVVTTNQLEGGGFDGTFSHRNAFSLGRNRLELAGNYSDTRNDYDLTRLLAAHEEDDTLWQAGLLSTRGLEFARSQQILGISAGTNINTFFNDDAVTGDIVSLFVPSRSRVRVFANERLVHTGILDFGLQQLDTRHYPQGSYTLRIELTEQSSGKTTTQTQFFTKTNRLVPFNKPEWLVQLGFARNELNPNTSEPIWQGLYRKRLNSQIEVGTSILGSTDLTIIEPQARLFWKGVELRANYSVSDKGDTAVSAFGQLLTDTYGALTLQLRRTLSGHNTPIQTTNSDVFDPLSQSIDLFSAQWTRTFGRIQLTLQGVRSDTNNRSSFRWGPRIRYPIITTAKHRLELQSDYVFNNIGKDSYGAFLTYQYTPTLSKWRLNNQTEHRNGETTQYSNRTQVEYDNRPSNQSPGTEVIATNIATRTDGQNTVTQDVQVNHTTNYLDLEFSGTHRRTQGDSSGSIGLQASTTFAIDGTKTNFVGGNLGEATAIIDLKGSAKGEIMVIKDGTRILGRGRVGERVSLNLEAFRTYNITIEPAEDDALVRYNTAPKQFKLINRSIEILSFDVERVYLLFGRLLGANGVPIAWQRLKGIATSALTDQFGNFQTEVALNDVMYIQNDAVTCTAAMPHLNLKDKIFKYVGDILCL